MNNTFSLDNVDPTTKLLEKRRQMFEVQEALDSQKTDYALKEEAFHRREEALRRKDLQLQESLIKFNKFLQENESKRTRALKRIEEEKKAIAIRENEIREKTQELEANREILNQMNNELKRKKKYQLYLEQVQRCTDEFPDIVDILNRYKTLKSTNDQLVASSRDLLQQGEDLRQHLTTVSKQKHDEILKNNNTLAEKQKDLEVAMIEKGNIQDEYDNTIRMASDRTLLLGQV